MKNIPRKHAALLCVLVLFFVSAPRAHGSMLALAGAAPEAAQLASQWSPHLFSGITSFSQGMIYVGKDVLNILRLPLGLLQTTAGAPMGMFSAGAANLLAGAKAPFELVWHTVMLPIRLLSLGTVK